MTLRRILGIDPGLSSFGWGLIEQANNKIIFITHGIEKTNRQMPLAERLLIIYNTLTDIITTHTPHVAAIEKTFVSTNSLTALKLGHARGVAMLVPAQVGLAIYEYAPNTIKQTITGSGHADKHQIRYMVAQQLPKAKLGGADAVDALAIALCHAHHTRAPAIAPHA